MHRHTHLHQSLTPMTQSPAFPHALVLEPIQTLSGSVSLPGSKSLSNRILLLSFLANGRTRIHNVLDSEDVRCMVEALKVLEAPLTENWDALEITVTGCGGNIPVREAHLFLGNAGTAMRPLTAALAIGQGRFVLDGVPRMRERPIQDLVDGLTQLGVAVRCLEKNHCPPVEIKAAGIAGGTARMSGALSSQYLTAILLAAPYAQKNVHVVITDTLVSVPYVQMTLQLMERFGVQVEHHQHQEFFVQGQQTYQSPGEIWVEGDASSASYFLAGAAITGGEITLHGCGSQSIQGDVLFANTLAQMGATVTWEAQSLTLKGGPLHGIDVDMNTMPDAAMTLAVVALFAQGPTAIRNIYNWRVKETERIQAVSSELRKLGAVVQEGKDFIHITPPAQINATAIDTYEDHRMAMAFSLAACGGVPIQINNPQCVAKTFPRYFEVLASLACPRNFE